MRTLSESAKLATGQIPGPKKYKQIFNEEFVERIESATIVFNAQSQQFQTLSDSVKTANSAIQLVMQQMNAISNKQAELNRQLAEMKALPPANGEDSNEAEVPKGE